MSRVSGSCSRSVPPHCSQAVGVSSATVMWPQASQVQAGMRWPHHSWREMHQSWMLVSQCSQTPAQRSGVKWMRPERTASRACWAASSTFMNHCSDTRGSSTAPLRSLTETWWV